MSRVDFSSYYRFLEIDEKIVFNNLIKSKMTSEELNAPLFGGDYAIMKNKFKNAIAEHKKDQLITIAGQTLSQLISGKTLAEKEEEKEVDTINWTTAITDKPLNTIRVSSWLNSFEFGTKNRYIIGQEKANEKNNAEKEINQKNKEYLELIKLYFNRRVKTLNDLFQESERRRDKMLKEDVFSKNFSKLIKQSPPKTKKKTKHT